MVKPKFALSYPLFSEDIVTSSFTDENGVVHNMGVKSRVNISSPEYALEHFPNPVDYTLQNQLDAGVALQDVPSPFMSQRPNDVESAVDTALDVLSDDNNFKQKDN